MLRLLRHPKTSCKVAWRRLAHTLSTPPHLGPDDLLLLSMSVLAFTPSDSPHSEARSWRSVGSVAVGCRARRPMYLSWYGVTNTLARQLIRAEFLDMMDIVGFIAT